MDNKQKKIKCLDDLQEGDIVIVSPVYNNIEISILSL